MCDFDKTDDATGDHDRSLTATSKLRYQEPVNSILIQVGQFLAVLWDLFFDHANAVDAEAADTARDAATMALVRDYDPDRMLEMELSTTETPNYRSHGDGSDGDATASALGKQAQAKRWKPQVMPRFGAEEAVIIIKPKGTLNLAQFRGSNQIGEAMHELAIWPAWEQNIIIIGIKNAQLIRQVLSIGQLELGGQAGAVQAYLKTSNNTSRGVIQAPVVGVRKLGKANVAAITFEGRKVPFNFHCWGEAVPVPLYRKPTPACPRCGTIGHRPDVCPNPQTDRCQACGEINLQEDHECQPTCLICGGPHLTESIQCNQKYRRGGAGTGAGSDAGGDLICLDRMREPSAGALGEAVVQQTSMMGPNQTPDAETKRAATRYPPRKRWRTTLLRRRQVVQLSYPHVRQKSGEERQATA
ncbi:hypothetical protein HPB49_022644 [Dermacentor silvarum]|uniref:Uncharacterized protein n=1 Tax=Dermacentor silvarum TaxID=543639 RepID=A0ACB8CN35_DERSI|nr:hypothetical protein HPB49_022644 [Dermacentor silvarum]